MFVKGGTINIVKEFKKGQGYKKAGFMRWYNAFQDLVRAQVQSSTQEDTYEVMIRAYEAVNRSHQDYVEMVYEAAIEAEGD